MEIKKPGRFLLDKLLGAAAILLLTCSFSLYAGGKRVVFIGDSITDGNWGIVYHYKPTSAERSQTDLNHIYGHSFVFLIASDYLSGHPGCGHQFFNRGFSGHRLRNLSARWQEDVLDLHPDILTVMVGTNDVHYWLEDGGGEDFDFVAWKAEYAHLLQLVKDQNPAVKLVLCPTFIARQGAQAENPKYELREKLTRQMAAVVRELAVEFDAIFLPYDEMFDKLVRTQPEPSYWLWDGIHPSAAGHRRMANLWKKKVKL